ncbi:MAG: TatD family hydrolase [Actinomycetota bacterium]
MIDTHAHLDMLEDAAAAVERAREAGVTRILTIGTSDAIELAERFDEVWAVVGYHPHQAGDDNDLDELRRLLGHPKAVAVGEIGLDYFRDYAPRDRQHALFDAQLELAREIRKPVVIHTRAADDDTRARLVAHDGTVVLHCFSSPHLLPDALEHGWYVSFAGNVTYKNATDLRLAAAQVPRDRILGETDAPYLAPQPVRGKTNEPAYVVHTLQTLAEMQRLDPDELARQIDANASACFGL